MNFFLVGLTLTILLEFPFYFYGLEPRRPARQRRLICLLANLVSYPVVIFILPGFFSSYNAYLAVAETFAPLSEILWLQVVAGPVTRREGLAIIAANLFSWLFGSWLLRFTS